MKNETKIVATAIDDNYVWPFLIMIFSATRNSRVPFDLVLGYEQHQLSREKMDIIVFVLRMQRLKFSFIELKSGISGNFNNYITSTTFLRLCLADSLESNFLWVDSDVLLLPDWTEIFSIGEANISTNICLAVRDPLSESTMNFEDSKNHALRRQGANYFNAGILYLNPKRWQELNYPAIWRQLHEDSSKLGFQFNDQCILNYLSYEKCVLQPSIYNFLVRDSLERPLYKIRVAHFAGGRKPWHFSILHLFLFPPSKHAQLFRSYGLHEIFLLIKVSINDPKFVLRIFLLMRSSRTKYNLRRSIKLVFVSNLNNLKDILRR